MHQLLHSLIIYLLSFYGVSSLRSSDSFLSNLFCRESSLLPSFFVPMFVLPNVDIHYLVEEHLSKEEKTTWIE